MTLPDWERFDDGVRYDEGALRDSSGTGWPVRVGEEERRCRDAPRAQSRRVALGRIRRDNLDGDASAEYRRVRAARAAGAETGAVLGGVVAVGRAVMNPGYVVRNRTVRMHTRRAGAVHRTRMQRRRLGQTEGEPESDERGKHASGPGTAHGTNISVNAWTAHNLLNPRWRVTAVTG